MHIRYGYTIEVDCAVETELAFILDVHPDQRGDITQPDDAVGTPLHGSGAVLPNVAARIEQDRHGNLLRRVLAPRDGLLLRAEGVLHHNGFADARPPEGRVGSPAQMPVDVVPFVLESPCCPTNELMDQAWPLFRHVPEGGSRVQAICDYVRQKLRFADRDPLSRRTAAAALAAGAGSVEDFAHAAIALCRCLEIPARYCTGYVPDSGERPGRREGGLCAWFEAFIDGQWWTFDAWHDGPRIGRILVARGFDAADVPVVAGAAFSLGRLHCFAETVEGARYPATSQDRRDHWQAHTVRTGT